MRLEEKNVVQYENRILLRKMLQIDLNPSNLNQQNFDNNYHQIKPKTVPSGLNSYASLNRATRIKDLANIIDNNRILIGKLQGA